MAQVSGAAGLVARRVAFVGVGQAPRCDLVPEICAQLDIPLDPVEFGALDGLSSAEIAALAPEPGDPGLATRLADGREVVVSKARTSERLARIVDRFAPDDFDLVVILSTGLFREFESRCPMVNAQRAVEAGILALAAEGQAIGIVQPLERQVRERNPEAFAPYRVSASHAPHGDRAALARALLDLPEAEIIILNSVAYSERDRAAVAAATTRPVVLARRIVVGAMRLLLDQQGREPARKAKFDPAYADRMARLTYRERQVMSLVAEGLSNKAIGRQLGISPRTVEIHRSKVFSKMEVPSTGALIRLVVSAEHPGL